MLGKSLTLRLLVADISLVINGSPVNVLDKIFVGIAGHFLCGPAFQLFVKFVEYLEHLNLLVDAFVGSREGQNFIERFSKRGCMFHDIALTGLTRSYF